MERRQLEHFLAIAESGSFSAAAARLGLAQPTLSQSMSTLEKELSASLFRRTKRGAKLTSAGEALVAPARQVARAFDIARTALEVRSHTFTGQLDIAAPAVFARSPVAALVGSFRRAHPSLTFRVHSPSAGVTVRQSVLRGVVDVGFVEDSQPTSSLREEFIGMGEIWALCPPGTAQRASITVDEMLRHDLVLPIPGTGARAILDTHIGPHRIASARIVANTEHFGAAVPLVLAGVGSTLIARYAAMQARAHGGVAMPFDPPMRQPMYVVGPADPPAVGEAFLQHCVDETAPILEAIGGQL